MPRLRLYRHPDCARCARLARTHRRLDWRGRFADTTATPPSGPLQLGEAVVEDLATGRLLRGADAFALLCREIPAYAPLRLLLQLPAFRAYVERSMGGCDGGACAVPLPADRPL